MPINVCAVKNQILMESREEKTLPKENKNININGIWILYSKYIKLYSRNQYFSKTRYLFFPRDSWFLVPLKSPLPCNLHNKGICLWIANAPIFNSGNLAVSNHPSPPHKFIESLNEIHCRSERRMCTCHWRKMERTEIKLQIHTNLIDDRCQLKA